MELLEWYLMESLEMEARCGISQDNELHFRAIERNGKSNDVWVMSADGSNVPEIVLESPDGTWWGAVDWSNDGQQLLIQNYIQITNSKVFLVDLKTKEKTLILGEAIKSSANTALSFDKNNEGVFFITDQFSQFNQLAYKNITTQKIEVITDNIGWDIDGFAISMDGKKAAFSVNENGLSSLYLLNTKTKKYRKVNSIFPLV